MSKGIAQKQKSGELIHIWYRPASNTLLILQDPPSVGYEDEPHTLTLYGDKDSDAFYEFNEAYYYIGEI